MGSVEERMFLSVGVQLKKQNYIGLQSKGLITISQLCTIVGDGEVHGRL